MDIDSALSAQMSRRSTVKEAMSTWERVESRTIASSGNSVDERTRPPVSAYGRTRSG
jgi:hypothetical protein